MRRTHEQAQKTIQRIVKRYNASSVRPALERVLNAVEANARASWDDVCTSTSIEEQDEPMCMDFYIELTGRSLWTVDGLLNVIKEM